MAIDELLNISCLFSGRMKCDIHAGYASLEQCVTRWILEPKIDAVTRFLSQDG